MLTPTRPLEFRPYRGTLAKIRFAADGEFWTIVENDQKNAIWNDAFGRHYQLVNYYKLRSATGREFVANVTVMHGSLGGRSQNVIQSQLEQHFEARRD